MFGVGIVSDTAIRRVKKRRSDQRIGMRRELIILLILILSFLFSFFRLAACNHKDPNRESYAEVSDDFRTAWLWLLCISFAVPEIGTFVRAARICFFRNIRICSRSEFGLVRHLAYLSFASFPIDIQSIHFSPSFAFTFADCNCRGVARARAGTAHVRDAARLECGEGGNGAQLSLPRASGPQ